MTPKVFRINHQGTIRKAAGLFVKWLENEGIEYISGVTLSPAGLNSKDRDSHHPYKKAATT
jgi:hypothetical protein